MPRSPSNLLWHSYTLKYKLKKQSATHSCPKKPQKICKGGLERIGRLKGNLIRFLPYSRGDNERGKA
jgi:hypothetical protein